MPSLQQLNKFKASFRNIGNEPAVLSGQNISYNDLPLPGSEPVTPSPLDASAIPSVLAESSMSGSDFGGSPPADETAESDIIDDLGFDDFLNTLPGDFPFTPEPPLEPEPADEEAPQPETGKALMPEEEDAFEAGKVSASPEETAPDTQVPDEGDDDFNLPEDLLSGLSDDLMEEGEGQPEDSFSDDSSSGDFSPDLDFDDSGIFSDTSDGTEDIGDGGFTGDEFGDDAFSGGDFQTPDLPSDENFGSGEEPADAGKAAEDGNVASSGLEVPLDDEFSIPDVEIEADAGHDAFDSFNFGEEAAKVETRAEDREAEKKAGSFSDLDDFSLSGLDAIFDKAAEGVSNTAAKTAGKESAAAPAAPKKLEDISFTEEDLARFQETFSLYPLNVRLACEELIAERSAPADQMDALINLIIRGGTPKEAASLAGKMLNRFIPVPKGYEKKTGEALEAEQVTFAYIFSRKFLPILRIFLIAVLLAASLAYLAWQFIYIPIHSESIYRRGYERIAGGEYERANERFNEAFSLHRIKQWFYRYAEAFRDERQYIYAEEKYDELLRYYPQDKKGALDYAALETYYLRNYSKADRIIRTNILDYSVDDQEGLLALGDNNLAWGEVDPSRYEDARQAYARLLERYGWQDPIAERMLLYFIRTDDLGQVIPLQQSLTGNSRKKTPPAILSELGGYLLNKQLEEVRGVPDASIERIEGVRDILIKASQSDPALPEPRYHLARYYNRFGNVSEERQTLESALMAFDAAREESPRRTAYRIDAERRYAQALTNAREFFPAEERLVKGIGIYEDALVRRLLSRSPEYGRLYADLGDLEYFTKSRDMGRALEYYRQAELNGWAPPEIQYRMGAAHYHLRQWEDALERFFSASSELPLNRRLLHALGNVSYLRGSYSVAQGYYRRLLDLLEAERARFPMLSPNERPDHMELAERLMVGRNNLGVTMEALAGRDGDPRYRAEAMALYSESARAWDALTRNPDTMIRSTGTNLGFLNSRNILHPQAGYEPRLFNQIDKDVLEPSAWETIAPPDYRLSD
ncbi:MAG: tetratricopeptide repeat protein [Treponema sp.]|jgi:tetratricopeptide (TPR) repeat protein|nr:tetratricopeptide repeat protein [Treponema sp.]